MNKAVFLFMAFVMSAAPVVRAEGDNPILTLQVNDNRGWFDGNGTPGKSGGQNLVYTSIGYRGPDYGIAAFLSHADTRYANASGTGEDFHLSSLLDTTVSAYYMKHDVLGGDLRGGLDANLPTGHAAFGNDTIKSMMVDNVSKELLLAPSYGKGLNIAPNVIYTHTLAKWVLGLGLRYEFGGEYNPTSDVANDNYKPGDFLLVSGSAQYKLSGESMLLTDLSGTYSARDRQGGADAFRQGDAYRANLRYVGVTGDFRTAVALGYGWQNSNQRIATGGMITEDRNSNGNLYEAMVNTGYRKTKSLMLTGLLAYKKVNPNGYGETDSLYDGGYAKVTAGVGAVFLTSEKLSLTADLRGYEIWNPKDGMDATGTMYRGVNCDIGFIYTFGQGEK